MSRRRASPSSTRAYDTTTRWLFRFDPSAWLERVGWPTQRKVRVLDSNRSRIIREVDNLVLVEDDPPWLALIEVQASYDSAIARRLRAYTSLVALDHPHPIRRAVLLLTPAADGPALSGLLDESAGSPDEVHTFGYRVIRVWQEPAERFLAGHPATVPLAGLADPGAMPREAVIEAMIQRVAADAPEEARPELLAAAYFLLGVRYPTDDADIILRRLQAVRESSTYKAVLAEGRRDGMREGRESGMREGRESGIREGRELGVLEGRAAEARALLHRLGTAKFGDGPDAATARAVGRIRDIERLEQLLERLLTADSWSELLAKP